MKELIKAAVIFNVFVVGAPIAGVVIKNRPAWQRAAFGLMLFLTIGGLMGPVEFGLTLQSVEWYRGHAKGFYFYLICAIGITLTVARCLEKPVGLKFLSLGLVLYTLHVFLCAVSIKNAPMPGYTLMAFHKSLIFIWVFMGAYCFFQKEDDYAFLIRVMSMVMVWEMFVMLKLRYLDGMYQVRGTFEHQNPLAMFSIMIGMIFLSAAIGPAFRGRNVALVGYGACGVTVLFTLSRAAMAIFGAGSIAIIGFSTMWKPTSRKLGVAASLFLGGSLVVVAALDTIVARFNQKGNKESGETREIMKDMCRAMNSDYPLGIGWNNYVHVANPPFRYCEIWWDYERSRGMRVDEERQIGAVESHYYLLLAENGWLGLGSYLVVIVYFLLVNIRSFFAHPDSLARWFSFGIAAGCSMNYVQSTLERVLTQPRNLGLWMIVLASGSKLLSLRNDPGFRPDGPANDGDENKRALKNPGGKRMKAQGRT